MAHADLLERGHPFRQWKSWTIPGAGVTMSGYSRSNDKTFFLLPELRAGIDCGLVEGWQPDTVFLTHTHLDHSKDLDYVAVKDSGVDIYLPAAAVPFAEGYIQATSSLNHNAPYDPSLAPAARLHGVRGGDEFALGKRGAHRVRVVDCEHKVPCVGFAFSSVKRAIKPEFEALKADGRLLAAKRREGVEIDHEVVTPLFAFLGDTRPDVFARSPWLLDYPVVVTECTFLDDDQLDRARRIGHTVWSELRPIVEANPATTFVLTHFSLRHSDPEIVAFFDKQDLSNVVAQPRCSGRPAVQAFGPPPARPPRRHD